MNINSPIDIHKHLNTRIFLDQEHLICFSIQAHRSLITQHLVHIGTETHLLVDLQKLFLTPILVKADSIIIAHNHPNGVVYPSQADIETTLRIKKTGKLLNIPLLDHIIFTKELFYSFSENNLI